MTFNRIQVKHLLMCAVLTAGLSTVTTSCSNDDNTPEVTYPVTIIENLPSELPSSYVMKSGSVTYTELNTGRVTTFDLPMTVADVLPAGTYDIDGTMVVTYTGANGAEVEQALRAVVSQQVISATSQSATLKWFFYNPENTLVFGEVYFAGSPNAAGTNGLYDTYLTIYNNTDEVQYADGIAIVESKLTNASTDRILTAANQRDANFTVQTVYVIPGSGKDVAINPGESIKIVDQAIDWSNQVAGALNHTDADFEWYDEVTTGTIRDTDNPAVPNLEKWFSYSNTIWLPSNQCNRSYAIVRFPEGMTAEKFLSEQNGEYSYINAATGKEMAGTKCYLIKYEWILDGINLSPKEGWTLGALSTSVDASYAAIADAKVDKTRFGKKFVRKVAGVSAAGNTVLMDTNDSANDFNVVSAN
ncbi:MAG: DUF4876 domain-containing protein [Muribaculaceae bacterium]|uniref:DUF4876 domain-containing protein n=1 Tax=Duncaniella TaxID=2518495 RepID=UPI000E801436|nr:DUF4876 domain-containing protein [Duncaniella sp.]MBJ2191571.1 DUF4876 domain-containing protein [Muribaculaceae bacterium]HBN63496.1 hypothetical protein [Porphyromonadaceae bacterium]